MRKKTILQIVCTAMMLLLCSGIASAFNVSSYTTQSKLSTGKWVKISIPESGVYEITYDELLEMGFSNPLSVRLYGWGGNRINEILNGKAYDDLIPVSVIRANEKIIFYGNGPIRYTLSNYSTTPHFTREFNPYSMEGCYFLTEENTTETQVPYKAQVNVTNYVDKPTSMTYLYHEKELISIGKSGKDMLGEEFTNERLLIDYYLPDIADSTVVVHTTVAAYPDKVAYVKAVIHSGGATDTTAYTVSSSRIYTPTEHMWYNYASLSRCWHVTPPSISHVWTTSSLPIPTKT